MIRTLLAAAALTILCAGADAQSKDPDDAAGGNVSLTVAESVSDAASQAKRSGRPVFAISYSKTCPICKGVRDTLATNASLQPVLAQFVSLAIDVDTPDFRTWERMFPRSSSAIPGLYVVSSAGEQVYGSEGGIAADALKAALLTSLTDAGRMPNEAALEKLTAAIDAAEEHRDAGRTAEALAALRPAEREFLRYGEILGLTPAGERATAFLNKLQEEGRRQLAAATAASESADRWATARALAATERDYGLVPALKEDIQEAFKAFGATAEDKLLLRQAKDLVRAEGLLVDAADSKRAETALQQIVKLHPGTAAAREAVKLLGTSSARGAVVAGSSGGMRKWSDVTGKHTVEAELVGVADGVVSLRTKQGKTVKVPVAKLNAEAKAFLDQP